jgi:hypothetical protein
MADKLVVDLRIYTIRPRGMPQYLKLFEELALPLALKYLSEPLGYYVTQIGPLNQVVHLWGFENLADMEQPGRPRRRSGFRQIPHCDGRSGHRAGGSDHADGRVQKPVLESAVGNAPSTSSTASSASAQNKPPGRTERRRRQHDGTGKTGPRVGVREIALF